MSQWLQLINSALVHRGMLLFLGANGCEKEGTGWRKSQDLRVGAVGEPASSGKGKKRFILKRKLIALIKFSSKSF